MAKITSIRSVEVEFKDVKSWFDANLAVDKIDLNDQNVYKYVYEEARWSGIFQCIDECSNVLMSDGSLKQIRDVQVGDFVKTFDEVSQLFTSSIVDNVFDNGYRECIELHFDNGKNLTLTYDHPILTKNRGWITAENITEEDHIISCD